MYRCVTRYISDNVFEGNGAGVSAATGAEIWIAGNNFLAYVELFRFRIRLSANDHRWELCVLDQQEQRLHSHP